MAKKAYPWFWEARDGWYVLLNGRRHFLGEHPADAPRPHFPTDRSVEIVGRLCDERPSGPLFLNNGGNKWTGDAVKCSFARLEKTVGRRIKHCDFRRTFITRKIIAGVDSHVVAKLKGPHSHSWFRFALVSCLCGWSPVSSASADHRLVLI